jgi:putative MATE family efflux protein
MLVLTWLIYPLLGDAYVVQQSRKQYQTGSSKLRMLPPVISRCTDKYFRFSQLRQSDISMTLDNGEENSHEGDIQRKDYPNSKMRKVQNRIWSMLLPPDEQHWWKPTMTICGPALIGMMADPVLSMMDTGFVGRWMGSVELAALGVCTSIFHLAFNSFHAITAATTTLVAAAAATATAVTSTATAAAATAAVVTTETNLEDNITLDSESQQQADARIQNVIQISLILGLIMGFGVLGTLQLAGPWCLARMGISSTSILYLPAIQYLTTRAWAAPAVLAIFVSEGAFRGMGNTRIPLVASLLAGLINLVLDPVLMLGFGMGVTGAAAATAISQYGSMGVYLYCLQKRNLLVSTQHQSNTQEGDGGGITKVRHILQTILGANLSMLTKQASLLTAWAYATAQATRLGPEHVAAHQVALSVWLILALAMDGIAVAAQILASPIARIPNRIRSLTKFMWKSASAQGLLSTVLLWVVGPLLPQCFTSDPILQQHIGVLIPHLAMQQLLISLTLVNESLIAGGQKFTWLAFGTVISTMVAISAMHAATSVEQIWNRGITLLFVGRLVSAVLGLMSMNFRTPLDPNKKKDGWRKGIFNVFGQKTITF